MTYATIAAGGFTSFDFDPSSRRVSPRTVWGAVALAFSIVLGACLLDGRLAASHVDQEPVAGKEPAPTAIAKAPTVLPPVVAATIVAAKPDLTKPDLALFDPAFSGGVAPVALALNSPLGPNFEPFSRVPSVPVTAQEEVLPIPAPLVAQAVESIALPEPAIAQLAENIPLPAPRPQDLRSSANQGPLRAFGRQFARQNRTSIVAATPPDNRTFFEKVFGMPAQPSGPALAYAAPEDGFFGRARGATGRPVLGYDQWTAVYDIAARTVYMPDGSKLEAHSGLGNRLDNPRFVDQRNIGATPPHVYDLEPRAQLFHGVQALRLNPVGGGGVFGRTGLLAHTYMLGPNGDSNGCVSFKDYNAFLQAFSNGTIKRLAVVASLN